MRREGIIITTKSVHYNNAKANRRTPKRPESDPEEVLRLGLFLTSLTISASIAASDDQGMSGSENLSL